MVIKHYEGMVIIVEKDVPYTIRIPAEMHSEITKMAKINRRSINNEMLTIFDEFIQNAKKELINKELTDEEKNLLGQIKSLPLDEQKAFIKKLSILSSGE